MYEIIIDSAIDPTSSRPYIIKTFIKFKDDTFKNMILNFSRERELVFYHKPSFFWNLIGKPHYGSGICNGHMLREHDWPHVYKFSFNEENVYNFSIEKDADLFKDTLKHSLTDFLEENIRKYQELLDKSSLKPTISRDEFIKTLDTDLQQIYYEMDKTGGLTKYKQLDNEGLLSILEFARHVKDLTLNKLQN